MFETGSKDKPSPYYQYRKPSCHHNTIKSLIQQQHASYYKGFTSSREEVYKEIAVCFSIHFIVSMLNFAITLSFVSKTMILDKKQQKF